MKAPLRASLLLIGVFFATHSWAGELFPSADPGELRIATYNVENYTTIPRSIGGKMVAEAGKPEPERDAVAKSIAELNPDIIGLMEIGTPAEFEDLKRRLRGTGLIYSASEYLSGADPSRHVALLSRFPIVDRHPLNDIPLKVGAATLHSPRGFLDVTVETGPGYRIRLICVHLKAKLEVAEYDATALREAEAAFLRKHVRKILSRDPGTRLLVMGDLNDTKNSRTLREISGKPDWPDSLRAVPLTDCHGESWTECWESAEVYSRIDYMMVSKKLEQEIDSGRSAVARFPFWREASDHCPLVLTLRKTRTEPAACPSPQPSP